MNIARLRDFRLFKRTAALALGGAATWLALVLLMSVVTHGRDVGQAAATQQAGWGAEAIGVFVEQAQTLSPIALANACGLGASSCARCHSGRRADAPVSDAETAPWHHDHGNVNYSCTGCHQGNPRVLKQDIAHRNLIADPRADAGKQCVSCHAAADIGALVQRYVLNPPTGHPVSE